MYSRIVIDIATNTVLERDEFVWTGPVAWCKGATDQEKATSASQNQLFQTLQQNYSTQFANQSAVLQSLQTAFNPILSAGIGQYGFTPQEDAALRTQADSGTAAAYRSAKAAAGESLAAVGGGNTFLPSSTKAGINASIATSAAQQRAGQQLDITRSGYDLGRQNFLTASNALSGVAQLQNPLGYSGAATSAGNAAFGSEEAIQQADAAASPWSTIGGILGGAAGSFLGPLGAGVGSSIGKSIGGAASGVGNPG